MEPGLLIDLSTDEVDALRRAADGLAEPGAAAASVERLEALSLVEARDHKIVLTELGKARLAALSRHRPYIDPNSVGFGAALSKALGIRNIE